MTASAPPLQDRVVALFGGGGRLAPFLTRRLLDAGAEVALVDASADGLARVTGQLEEVRRMLSSLVQTLTPWRRRTEPSWPLEAGSFGG